MKIETKRVRDGENIGDTVWICHYLRPELGKKPLRNLPPTRVMVVSNSVLPTPHKVYYSETHFSPFGKNNVLLSKVISPVDNTGYRSNPGNEVSVFTTQDECITEWNKQVSECCNRLKDMELSAAEMWRKDFEKTSKLKF